MSWEKSDVEKPHYTMRESVVIAVALPGYVLSLTFADGFRCCLSFADEVGEGKKFSPEQFELAVAEEGSVCWKSGDFEERYSGWILRCTAAANAAAEKHLQDMAARGLPPPQMKPWK